MNFQQSLEQEMLRKSVAATMERLAGQPARLALADLGVLGLLQPEQAGGAGLGFSEAVIVLQEAGRAGVGHDLAETLLLAEAFTAAHPQLADAFMAGEITLRAAVAGQLVQANGRLRGELILREVRGPSWIAAPVGDQGDLAFLPPAALDLIARGAIEDGAAEVGVVIDLPPGVQIVRAPGFTAARAMLDCAELLGAADMCFALGVDYIKDRQQFGQPLGANQALKHIAADSFLALENLRLAVEYAAAARDTADHAPGDPALAAEAERAHAVMLAYVPRTAREIAETAIQLHGGIGLTWEYRLNLPLRRIVSLGMRLGSATDRALALHQDFLAAAAAARPHPAAALNGVHHDTAL